ncbi:MAG: T9SS type A sorting domain-containing protein [Candidatus Lokiarchaeota archaeon]|nr:T9SS type A sorting domain-containing protein [Candidatus Lokiarchaeota archaeon]
MKKSIYIILILISLTGNIFSQIKNTNTVYENEHQVNVAEVDNINSSVSEENWMLIFSDGFENVDNGQYPAQNGWENHYSGAGAYVTEERASSGEKSFKLIGEPNWARVDAVDIPYYDKLRYQAMIYIPSPTNSYPRLGLWNSSKPSQWADYPIIRFERVINKIYCFGAPSGGAPYTEIGDWQPDRWYRIEAIIDFGTNQLTTKLNGTELATLNITSPEDYTQFHLGIGGHSEPGQSVVYFDDVRIFKNDLIQPTISGYVRNSTGDGISDATMNFSNGGGNTTTNSSGYYSHSVEFGWSGMVTPSKNGYTFDPDHRSYTNVTDDDSGENYTSYINQHTISGYVRTSDGTGISDVRMSFSNGGGSTTTNSSGYYSHSVEYGWSGMVTPSKNGYKFDPDHRPYTNVTDDDSWENYTGERLVSLISIDEESIDITNILKPFAPDQYDIKVQIKNEHNEAVDIKVGFFAGDPDGSNFTSLKNYQGRADTIVTLQAGTSNEPGITLIHWKGISINTPDYKTGQLVFIKILEPVVENPKASIILTILYNPFYLNEDAYYWTVDEITNANSSINEMINTMVWLLPIDLLQKIALSQALAEKAEEESDGLCHGIVGTSVLYKNGDLSKPASGPVYNWNKTVALPDIRRLWWEQFELKESNLFQTALNFLSQTKYYLGGGENGWAKCFQIMCQKILQRDGDDDTLRHTVAAYKMIEIKNSSGLFKKAKVYVYDANKPYGRYDTFLPLTSPICIELANENGIINYEGYKFDNGYPLTPNYDEFGVHYPNQYSQQEIIKLLEKYWVRYLTNLFDLNQYFVSFACPVEPLITDQNGRRVGLQNGIIINEISEAEFDTIGDLKLFKLPKENNYHIEIMAIEDGNFDHTIINPKEKANTEIILYDDVELRQGGAATLELIVYNNNYTMHIDENGDGQIDTTRQPDEHTIVGDGLSVWPGDTNDDGIVNQGDILPLGLFWQQTGPAREFDNKIQWVGQPCTPWSPNENATYADANGDGAINQGDILPVGLNWEKTHGLQKNYDDVARTELEHGGVLKPVSRIEKNQKQLTLDIYADGLKELFGISFEISYPTNKLKFLSAKQGEVFDEDALFYNKENASGNLGIAISQKAFHENVTQNGKIATIKFQIQGNSINSDEINIQKISAVNKLGNDIHIICESSKENNVPKNNQNYPDRFHLYANYPNPFNPTTTITYSVPKASHVQLQIFDLTGRLVKTLYDNEQQTGMHSVIWDARDESGNVVTNGMYICRMTAGAVVKHQKMILAK